MIEFKSFRFMMSAGTVERRIFMDELKTWLTECIGVGFFTVITHTDELEPRVDEVNAAWVIVCEHDYLKVLIKQDADASLFALKWS